MNRDMFRKIRKNIIALKFTMIRGYSWVSFLMVGVVAAASVTPYVKQVVPWVQMWQMVALMVVTLFLIGFIDNKFKFLHTEQDWAVERNPILMQGLRGELRK